MQDITPPLRLLYLTLPTPTEPTLNIGIGDNFARFRVNRNQLINLNCQIADAILRGCISDEHRHPDDSQMSFELEASAPL
jgi:hypothetical protein